MTLNNLLLRPLNALAMLIWPLAITTPHLTAAEREYELITYSKPGALGTVFFDISNGGTIVGAWSPDGFIHQAGLIHRLGEDTSVEVPARE